jgi:hypothetical protein
MILNTDAIFNIIATNSVLLYLGNSSVPMGGDGGGEPRCGEALEDPDLPY